MKHKRLGLRLLAGALLLGGIGITADNAHAALVTHTYRVTTPNDDLAATNCNSTGAGATGNYCSLRGALADANADTTADLINIVVPAFHIVITNGTLYIDNTSYPTIRIMGAGAGYTAIDDAHNGDTIFETDTPGGFQNLTIENGGCATCGNDGAGLYADAATGITNVVFLNNYAGTGGYGGAIYAEGFYPVSITNSTFQGNQAYGGGAIYNEDSIMSVQSSTFKNNVGCGGFNDTTLPLTASNCDAYGYAGAIYNDEILTVNTSTITGNAAGYLAGATGYGGGIYNDYHMQVNASYFTYNVAGSDGGGLYGDDYDAINNTAFGNNVSGEFGGGVEEEDYGWYNGDNFYGNVAGGSVSGFDGQGGGMYADDYISISNSTFTGNKALNYCGTIYGDPSGACPTSASFKQAAARVKTARISPRGHYGSILPNSGVHTNQEPGDPCGGQGGGIYNDDTLNFTNVNFSSNSACDGGGLYDASNYGYDNIDSSRFANNTAGFDGGAIWTSAYSGSPYTLLHNTQVVSNHAYHAAGGIWNENLHDFAITGTTTVISGNSAPVCPNIFLPCT